MKRNMKWTVLAVAIAAAAAANANANDHGHEYKVKVDYDYDADISTDIHNRVQNKFKNEVENDVSNSYSSSYSNSYSNSVDNDVSNDVHNSYSTDLSYNSAVNKSVEDHSDITYDSDTNINKAVDEHGVSAELESDLSLTSDIDFTGNPTVSGDLAIDSAAIAVIDNRQSSGGNFGLNDQLTNDASIGDEVAADASGNLQFNVAAGDNNLQDNAAALSAADASFAFGLADSKVLVQQTGAANKTVNQGVTNTAGISGNAFANATGNIGVNVTSGNNNAQKNSLAASVATSRYASAAVSSNQTTAGNFVTNSPKRDVQYDTVRIGLFGKVSGTTVAVGAGDYRGTESGSTASRGEAYQAGNFYLDTWQGETHVGGGNTGHIDVDGAIQGAIDNPWRGSDQNGNIGGLAFDTGETGSYQGHEEGDLGFLELGYADLYASLSGYLQISRNVVVADATNTASLSGNAFNAASGNIGVNVSAGTGNQQANSLSLAVAQPSTAAPPPPTGGEGG